MPEYPRFSFLMAFLGLFLLSAQSLHAVEINLPYEPSCKRDGAGPPWMRW